MFKSFKENWTEGCVLHIWHLYNRKTNWSAFTSTQYCWYVFTGVMGFVWYMTYDCYVGPLLCRLFDHKGRVYQPQLTLTGLWNSKQRWCNRCRELNGPPHCN
jgi:hypothetical protein